MGPPGQGFSDGTGAAYGVWGLNLGGTGVRGESQIGNGVLGQSRSGVPILGRVAAGSTANTIAIYGAQQLLDTRARVPGLAASGSMASAPTAMASSVPPRLRAARRSSARPMASSGAYAGAFYGPVVVSGNFTVVGGAKSAAVPHPDGTHRRLYCMESPESWFEDFGTGQLECGRAEILIDPDFAALVRLDDYHVFLTDCGNQQCSRVACQTPAGFTGLPGRGHSRPKARTEWPVRLARRGETEGHHRRPTGDRDDSAGTCPPGRAGDSDTDATDAAPPALMGGAALIDCAFRSLTP